MPEPILQLSGLDAYYGDFQALYGVDMVLEAGEAADSRYFQLCGGAYDSGRKAAAAALSAI